MDRFTYRLIEPIFRMVRRRPGVDESKVDRDCASQPRGGLVLFANGVGGMNVCATSLRYVIRAGGLRHAFQMIPWGHGWGRWYADLSDVANRDANARSTAEAIRQFQSVQPGDPVFLVGKSGGAGVALKTLELLDDQIVERVILLAPAVSSGYDLTQALRAVRTEMVVFWSPLDVVILGAGTRVFGTIDRVKTVSSGLVGFQIPRIGDSTKTDHPDYARLRQVRWRLEMAASGHFGGHFGPDSPWFLKKYVLPLLRVETSAPR